MRKAKAGGSLMIFVVAAAAALLAACAPSGPIKIGYIGSLSGSGADIGEQARNGVIMSIDERNAAGGIKGRRLELVIADDGSKADTAKAAAESLVAAGVELAIGTNSSVMADAVLPAFDKAKIVLMSPNVSAMRFVGVDDYYFRINSSTRVNSSQYAQFLAKRRGAPPVALLWDSSNATFAKSWLEEFRSSYAAAGGAVAAELPFDPKTASGYGSLVDEVVGKKAKAVVFVANAMDSARFAQLLRKAGSAALFAAAEWAGTAQLIELGGRSVEGLLMLQEYDPFDPGPRYAAFRKAYNDRFKADVSFTAVLTWDTCQAAFAALEGRTSGESAKAALIRIGTFQGLQQKVVFDAYGDSRREAVFSEIKDGQYRKAD